MINFKNKKTSQNPEKKQKKDGIIKNLYALFDGRERVIGAFKSEICQIK